VPTSTFVLIHGAWHGAWCWHRVATLLQNRGHMVVCPDLPGRGGGDTPPREITMRSYTDHVGHILNGLDEPAVLVGHSFGGAVVSQVAELQPEAVKLAVYLSAFLLRDGQSVWRHGLPPTNGTVESILTPAYLIVDETEGTLDLRREVVPDGFYHDCSAEDRALGLERWTPEPVAPLRTTLSLTGENYGRIRRSYIFCEADRVVPTGTQRRMCRLSPCDSEVSIQSGHSPFLSKPEVLARLLTDLDSAAGSSS
jgi:pimeloyl-ACP methyl ester carboxylesterase